MERLARQQYATTKDPHDCALAYVALGKRAVLQGLFRSAGNKKARMCARVCVFRGVVGELRGCVCVRARVCVGGGGGRQGLRTSGAVLERGHPSCPWRCPAAPPLRTRLTTYPPPNPLPHTRTLDRGQVSEFLARDFGSEANRTAAAKNAFHLMGQHRHALAAAFFLLGAFLGCVGGRGQGRALCPGQRGGLLVGLLPAGCGARARDTRHQKLRAWACSRASAAVRTLSKPSTLNPNPKP